MTDTTTATSTWKIGDRFTYTGDPIRDGLPSSRRGATGTIRRPHEPSWGNRMRWIVAFDGANSDDPWVTEENISPLPATGWKTGDRFVYTGDPARDFLDGSIERGVSGTLVASRAASTNVRRASWWVEFDARKRPNGGRLWASEGNISRETPMPTAGEVVDAEAYWGRAERAETALAEFKALVVRVARQTAADHGWCDVVDTALRGMGLPVPRTVEVSCTLSRDVEISLAPGEEVTRERVAHALAAEGFRDYWLDRWEEA